MNTYNITYWPPPAQVGTQTYTPVTLTIQAVDYSIGEDMVIFVDTNRSVIFSLPTGLYPVIQRTVTA